MKRISIFLLFIFIITTSCTDKKEASRAEINAGLKEMYESNLEAAAKHFNKAIEWDPSNAEPYLYLGRVKLNNKKVTEAMEYVKKSLELNPEYGEAYRTKAQINTILGKKDLACEDYKNAKKYGIKNLDNYLKFCW